MNRTAALLLLPRRAPMLLLLLLISVYLGVHSTLPDSPVTRSIPSLTAITWGAECLQLILVVVVCTIPDVLLRQVSSLMASSRVISLVISLLLVTMGGLYLLHLDVLSVVVILGVGVLLARLDLVRIRIVPSPLVLTVVLSLLVLFGLNVGRAIGPSVNPPPSAEERALQRAREARQALEWREGPVPQQEGRRSP
jgi:hypothetical protein